MDQQETSEAKWEFKVSKRLTRARAEQIWPLFTDFFNLHKWFPGLSTCYGVRGTNGEINCIRFCSGFSIPSNDYDDDHKPAAGWSKERLVSIDHPNRTLCYEIVESNIGFDAYASTVKIVPGTDGCVIEWLITVDPVKGTELDDMVKKYEKGLQGMATRMEEGVEG